MWHIVPAKWSVHIAHTFSCENLTEFTAFYSNQVLFVYICVKETDYLVSISDKNSPCSGHYAYRQISYIRRTLTGNKTVDDSDVVGASPVGAASTTSSYLT